MLATVLRTEIASHMSIAIMRAFVSMRHYIGSSDYRIFNIENKIIEHDENIKKLQESFDKLEEKRRVNEIYFDGQIFDAYAKIQNLFSQPKEKLIIIDAYADITILDIIKRLNVDVLIITKPNNLLTRQDILKYSKQYNNLRVVFDNTFHDRYFIMDEKKVYHCGASINRLGYKTFSITKVGDNLMCEALINKVNKIINENKE